MSFLAAGVPSIPAVLKSNLCWKLAASCVRFCWVCNARHVTLVAGCKYSRHHHHHHLWFGSVRFGLVFFSLPSGMGLLYANVISLRTIIMGIWERGTRSHIPRWCNQSLPSVFLVYEMSALIFYHANRLCVYGHYCIVPHIPTTIFLHSSNPWLSNVHIF